MKARGEVVKQRFVAWGPAPREPEPGDGLRYESGRRYLVVEKRPKSARMTKTVFVLLCMVLGPEDEDPVPMWTCWRTRSKRC